MFFLPIVNFLSTFIKKNNELRSSDYRAINRLNLTYCKNAPISFINLID